MQYPSEHVCPMVQSVSVAQVVAHGEAASPPPLPLPIVAPVVVPPLAVAMAPPLPFEAEPPLVTVPLSVFAVWTGSASSVQPSVCSNAMPRVMPIVLDWFAMAMQDATSVPGG